MKTFGVRAYYGVTKTYSKILDIQAETEEEAEELAKNVELDVTDGSWDEDEDEVDYADFGYEIEYGEDEDDIDDEE